MCFLPPQGPWHPCEHRNKETTTTHTARDRHTDTHTHINNEITNRTTQPKCSLPFFLYQGYDDMGFKSVGGEEESDRDSGGETEFIRNLLSIMGDGVKRWDSGCHTTAFTERKSTQQTFPSIRTLFLGARIAAKNVSTTGCIPITYHVLYHSTADEPARIRHSSLKSARWPFIYTPCSSASSKTPQARLPATLSNPPSKVELSPAKITRVNIGCFCIGPVAR